MASAQVVEMSVADNSPSQDFNHPDDHFQSKCFYYFCILSQIYHNILKLMKLSFSLKEFIGHVNTLQTSKENNYYNIMYITDGYWGNKFPYSGKWRYHQAPWGGGGTAIYGPYRYVP